MARVTALRERRGGRLVDVEVDGAAWRALPVDVVVRTSLRQGVELDRPRLRDLRRELRRAEALAVATRAISRRDLSRARLEERLAERGVPGEPAAEAVEALARAGYVDDERVAHARAAALAARALGDAAIRWDLERQGVPEALAAAAVAALEPEPERARAVVAARGRSVATARYLARKGFGDESVEAAVGSIVADEG